MHRGATAPPQEPAALGPTLAPGLRLGRWAGRVSWVWAAPHLLRDGPVAAGLERAPWGLLKAVPSSPGAPSKGLFIPLSVSSAASVPESRPPRGGGSARPGPQRPLPATAACGDRPCHPDR